MTLHVVMRAGLIAGQAASPSQDQGVELERPRIEDCETLFSTLDGRDLAVMGMQWRIEVFSVCELAGHRYMQLALLGESQFMLTLRVAPRAELQDLIPALLTWVTHPTSTGEILDVP